MQQIFASRKRSQERLACHYVEEALRVLIKCMHVSFFNTAEPVLLFFALLDELSTPKHLTQLIIVLVAMLWLFLIAAA